MSFKSVYRSLQEVFPQVDLRILKAVAIEHYTDVDAAVEFILSDVLPSLSAPQEECHVYSRAEEESPGVEQSILGFPPSPENDEAISSLHSDPAQLAEKNHGTDHATAASHAISLRQEETICESSSVGLVVESKENTSPSEYNEMVDEATRINRSEMMSPLHENAVVNDTIIVNTPVTFSNDAIKNNSIPPMGESVVDSLFLQDCCSSSHQLWSHEMGEPAPLFENHLQPSTGSLSASSLMQREDTVVEWTGDLLADTQGLFVMDVPSALGKTFQDFPESSIEDNLVSMKPGLAVEESLGTTFYGCGYETLFPVNKIAETLALGNEGATDDEALGTTFDGCGDETLFPENKDADTLALGSEGATDDDHSQSASARSGNAVSMDYLEGFVTDCKCIKNTLVSAMESVVDVMKEVDLHEKEADLAKEAASKAGLDILEKVEDLKEMLKHAKEANNMHAGEVYGEKSILATEARELQARLLSLSDQRYKSLSIIEEIHQTLKERLATAEKERIKAEQERLEKEDQAHKALIEQEEIMERVVHESKELQREAEENSLLREFLMERGRLVDTLQGEISVICEDVLALKDRVDGRMPLGRTLSSSQVLCSLASSTSSRTSASSDKLPCPASESHTTESQESLKTQQPEQACSREKSTVEGADSKVMSDDDWEYFDEESELRH